MKEQILVYRKLEDNDIDVINSKIPPEASPENKMADKEYVNNGISTASADFKGTFTSQADMEAVTGNRNDYCYLITTDSAGNVLYNRYIWVDGTGWVYSYTIKQNDFSATEWAAIQSGITAALVSKLSALPTNAEIKALTVYEDVYIGVAAASSTVIDNAYHHDTIVRGRPVLFSNVEGYLWVVLPEEYLPVCMMNGLETSMDVDSTTTINNKTYNIYKSTDTYTGTFNIYMF